MKIKALVAVRSGSVRVENKNIRPFAGSTLLERKLLQLKRISFLDGVVVNSNDDAMLDIARKCGCEAVKRDQLYASNEVSMSDVYENMAQNCDADIIAYTNVTNPLLKDETIYRAIEIYQHEMNLCDSLNSAHLIKEFLFLNNKPLNYDLRKQPRSQDLPDIAALNFAINILPRETMISCKNVVGLNPKIFLIDEIEATDIDNQIDFDFAEFIIRQGENI
jgi:N-acylneuraminate cytidylyltransferase